MAKSLDDFRRLFFGQSDQELDALRDAAAAGITLQSLIDNQVGTVAGDPEGAVTAPVGTLLTRSDGGAATTLYVKESGTGNTGWAAK